MPITSCKNRNPSLIEVGDIFCLVIKDIEMQCRKFVTGDRGFKDIKEIEVEIY